MYENWYGVLSFCPAVKMNFLEGTTYLESDIELLRHAQV